MGECNCGRQEGTCTCRQGSSQEGGCQCGTISCLWGFYEAHIVLQSSGEVNPGGLLPALLLPLSQPFGTKHHLRRTIIATATPTAQARSHYEVGSLRPCIASGSPPGCLHSSPCVPSEADGSQHSQVHHHLALPLSSHSERAPSKINDRVTIVDLSMEGSASPVESSSEEKPSKRAHLKLRLCTPSRVCNR